MVPRFIVLSIKDGVYELKLNLEAGIRPYTSRTALYFLHTFHLAFKLLLEFLEIVVSCV